MKSIILKTLTYASFTIALVALFAFMVFMFIRGFNKQQINKHTKRLEENEKRMNAKKDTIDE